MLLSMTTGPMPNGPEGRGDSQVSRPEWFAAFLADGGTRKPSAHTLKAYCQDFDAITAIIVRERHGSVLDVAERHCRTAYFAC